MRLDNGSSVTAKALRRWFGLRNVRRSRFSRRASLAQRLPLECNPILRAEDSVKPLISGTLAWFHWRFS